MLRIAAVTTIAVAVTVAATSGAEARPNPKVGKRFEANKSFGLGIMLGSPSGLNGKLYLSDDTALDFGIGSYDDFGDDRGLHLHASVLWHPVVLASPDPFELPLYLGIGFRYLDHDDFFFDGDDDDHEHLGVRAPLGLMLDFNRVPIDIFLELALIIDLVTIDDRDGSDHGRTDLDATLGLRYYF